MWVATERDTATSTMSLLGVPCMHAHHSMDTCWLRLEVS